MDAAIFVTHLDYNRWATRRALEAAGRLTTEQLHRDLHTSDKSLQGTLTHLYQSDHVWVTRLRGTSPLSFAEFVAPAEFSAFQSAWLGLHDDLLQWAKALPEEGWLRPLNYQDLRGNPYQTPVWQVILHMVNHATHHRGQVSAMIRQMGGTPAPLDLIAFYRGL